MNASHSKVQSCTHVEGSVCLISKYCSIHMLITVDQAVLVMVCLVSPYLHSVCSYDAYIYVCQFPKYSYMVSILSLMRCVRGNKELLHCSSRDTKTACNIVRLLVI